MIIPNPGLKFGIKSQQRVLVANEFMIFYVIMNRNLTVDNFDRILPFKFKYQWEALDKKAKVTAEPPQITKNYIIMKCYEAMCNHLSL